MAAQPDKKTVIKDLLELGKSKGQLSTKEILDALGELDFDPEQIEKFYDTLEVPGRGDCGGLRRHHHRRRASWPRPRASTTGARHGRRRRGHRRPGQGLFERDRPGAPAHPGRGNRPGHPHFQTGTKRPKSACPRPTCAWWSALPSAIWAAGCSSWT